ncbi:MAG TPA: hypothetical protein VHF90_04635 [Thermoleophilaceae bacterium]|nr:hypothetical protein [Thermoleophilaceae bacterium]
MRNSNTLRTLVCALLALVAVVLTLPAAANAGSRQLSMMQDDAEMFGERPGEDPAAAMREMKELGVDVLRTNVLFYRIYDDFTDRRRPANFDPSDPNSPQYTRWGPTDNIVRLARQNGIKLLFTVSGPGPHWASDQPGRCRGRNLCPWRPNVKVFGQFVEAVAKRYRGQVDWYSIYNEPNIGRSSGGTGWLMPQASRTRAGRVETAGVIYRKLWQAGYRAIAKHDRARRGRVLFGEVAAIGEPLPKLYAALCLDRTGKPFRGALRRAHDCGRVSKLRIGGWAIHPYNQGGFGPPNRTTNSKTALPQQYLPRLHRLMRQAAARGRVSGGKGIYITEFGYQTNPPDRISTITPKLHARYINESDRLFFGDPRVKTVSQYQLVDVNDVSQYNSGLRFAGGTKRKKASYDAYRIPIVVTRRSSSLVEVYGQVRPARQARLANVFSAPQLQFAPRGRGFTTIRRPRLNSVGIFRMNIRRGGAAAGRWRIRWNNGLIGGVSYSRVAKAGKPLRYYRD